MIACLPPPPSSAYRLVEDLRESMTISGVYRVAMDNLENEQALLTKLGSRGWGRIHHFRNYYSQSWGEHQGGPVSARAIDALTRFVAGAIFPSGVRPSVFLTDQGGLELCWEDTQGAARQIEFKPDGIDYYVAATGEEGSAGWDRLPELIHKLTAG